MENRTIANLINTRRYHARHVALFLMSCGFATSLAGGPAAMARSDKLDACSLIPTASAGDILGAHVVTHPIDTSAAGPGAASMCNYATGHVGGGFMLLAGNGHYGNAAAEVARRKKEALSDTPPTLPKPSFTDVKGLGDAAYLAEMPGSFQLHVLSGGMVLVVTIVRDATPESIAKARRLAAIALQHLQ